MKAAIVTAPGKLEVQDIPMPQPGPYDCLVKIETCAVCAGTDTAVINDHFPSRAPYPLVLGHESAGTILEIGSKVRSFQVGQVVTRPGAILAGESSGGLHSSWGGYAEYGLVRDTRAAETDGIRSNHLLPSSRTPIPGDVDMISASLSINHREIISVVAKIRLDAGSRVAIVGSGYNGLLFSLLCNHSGAGKVMVLGSPKMAGRALGRYAADALVDYHAADARQQALDVLGGFPTHTIDAVGSLSSLPLAGSLLGRETAFGCYGMADRGKTDEILRQLAKGRPALDMATDEASFVNEWYRLWQAGFFQNPGIYDDVMPMDQIQAAFERVQKREALKIVISI